jgi:4-diphosphocytidyl-2-C-methyl-D-erythritol kinase
MRPLAPVEPTVREHARAKLNLDLLVTGRRADGYHELDSLVAFADVGDELTIRPGDGLSLELAGPFGPELAGNPSNLVLAAARALAAAAGIEPRARLRLVKRLPVASGIGGGSADAAAALRGLRRHWALPLGDGELRGIGLQLGADIPVCLVSRTARMRGVGDRCEPAELPAMHVVLLNPLRPLATADVFKALPYESIGPRAEPVPAVPDLHWLARSRNDLVGPARALLPVIGELLAALAEAQGCRLARMSGSGPTCFGLFDGATAAKAAAAAIGNAHPGWWVAACRAGDPDRLGADRR